MVKIIELQPDHINSLYDVCLEAEGNGAGMTLLAFISMMNQREGWAIFNNDKLIGSITLSDFVPKLDIILHCSILKEYHGRWLNRKILNTVYGRIFNELELPKVSSYSISGVTDKAEKLLKAMGFEQDGKLRKGAMVSGEYYPLKIFTMLREECRWI